MAEPLVNAQVLEAFFSSLADASISRPGYLVGRSSLLLVAGKTSTFDIDVQFSTSHEHHAEFIRCLRTVSREMAILVELASPEQFIPLQAGFQERYQFVGQYGSLDVFHFDYYCIALGKVHRGNEKDFDDVVHMVQTELISLSMLESYLEQILPDYEFYGQPTTRDVSPQICAVEG